MGFDEEWAQLRTEAAARLDTSMRLNQLPADQGGGGGKLVSSAAAKSAAANTIQNEIMTKTQTAGKHAAEATESAVSTFGGWATGSALKKVQTTWEGQVKTLMGRLGKERDGLRQTNTILSGVDTDRGGQIRKVPSGLDKI
ncbi:hypothetical protein [Streptomyces roseolilacinus]|uniref:Uncharacterized protein n=1 Tax=Streptomyces roseolilacinus TaxID=66904 RepID=A0A918B177_9ACTN|nr:hypothetical protein [Streptomyces roseolilacinus]GGQ03262.1 hypothetical protein GCM10010249_21900 [Streptomyces roseolilacinus]